MMLFVNIIGHVYTKRYLISKNSDYFNELSDDQNALLNTNEDY